MEPRSANPNPASGTAIAMRVSGTATRCLVGPPNKSNAPHHASLTHGTYNILQERVRRIRASIKVVNKVSSKRSTRKLPNNVLKRDCRGLGSHHTKHDDQEKQIWPRSWTSAGLGNCRAVRRAFVGEYVVFAASHEVLSLRRSRIILVE